jgi:hypothetical protein
MTNLASFSFFLLAGLATLSLAFGHEQSVSYKTTTLSFFCPFKDIYPLF